ncbi:hypothetical protein BaRGS_00002511, partial [Batillaria attramentaria]
MDTQTSLLTDYTNLDLSDRPCHRSLEMRPPPSTSPGLPHLPPQASPIYLLSPPSSSVYYISEVQRNLILARYRADSLEQYGRREIVRIV